MKVLGINFSNDSAAALLVDGHIVGAVQEERLSRIKHDSAFPTRAVRYCLDAAGLTLRDIDSVAFFWNPGKHAEPSNYRMTAVPRDHLEYLYAVPVHLMRHFDGVGVARMEQTMWLEDGHPLRIHYLTHHDCHAAGAFYLSGYESAALITVDGYGERTATHIARADASGIETLMTWEFPHSVGSLYAAFTQYLGFRPNNGEGKVMGLASYGGATYDEAIRSLVHLDDEGFELDLSFFNFYMHRSRRYSDKLIALLGPERRSDEPLTQRHMDIAAGLQRVTEELLLHIARRAKALSGESRVCLSGGVVLNCVANSRIKYESGFEEAYFMPAASDAGTSLGAALYAAHVLGGDAPVVHPENDYHGPGYSDSEIEAVLTSSGCAYRRVNDIATEAAKLLAESKIVGWFQGRAEYGPRALGSRSILADPRRQDTKEVLNARVKFREPFRPFAPVVLEERCGDFFDHGDPSPYMLLVYDTLPEKVDVIPSVTHVDGGARVQTVTRDANGLYYDVVKAFGEITGVPVLVNTSFNIRGEPIVTSVQDALKCFFTTDMDALAIGSFLLEKAS